MRHISPSSALLGGVLIGIAAVTLLLFNGRIMGVTGIARGVMEPQRRDWLWRVVFLAGLAAGPFVYTAMIGAPVTIELTRSVPVLIVGGFLVGFGTCAANGCTSGHGVCGLGLLSRRSVMVTVTFMITSMATVFVIRHLLGGA